MHRNFNDPSAPYNDEIVQTDTWKKHYNTDEPEQYNEINLGDVNAIQIGTWVTFRVRSSFNLNIRTVLLIVQMLLKQLCVDIQEVIILIMIC